jgi:thioredoxin 1
MADVVALTDGNFEAEVVKSSTPVLVDVMAAWCTTCRQISPTVDAVAADYRGKIKVGKLNIDESPQMPLEYDIKSIPTLLVFKNGKVIGRHVGEAPREKIDDLLSGAL